jgi:hypothetical protein
MPFYCGKRSAPGLFMNTHYSGRSSRPARLFRDRLRLRLRSREAHSTLTSALTWKGYGLSRFATAFMNNPGAGPGVVLGPKQSRPPDHLSGAHKHGATYSSHRARSTYSLGKERVLLRRELSRTARLGWAGNRLHPRFFEPAASHLPASPFPRNKGLLGQTPSGGSLPCIRSAFRLNLLNLRP